MLDYWYVAVQKAVCHRKGRQNITLVMGIAAGYKFDVGGGRLGASF